MLAGAGPGDVGLLTLKSEKYIKEADCLVYDRLLSVELLDTTKPGCELIYVGKENHKHVMKQDDINELLYQKSKQHGLVVRLKGGDPYVFGRGGEEALYLTDRNVEVEVVPGVSSSVAALADAGIPITHRGIAKGFQVITAHSRKDEEADIDYSLLTDETITCVFLMGLAHVKSIAEGLMRAGRRTDTAIAVISNGTTARQKKCVGTLADIGEKIGKAGLISPAIIVVGDVVGLNERLSFFEKRPLFGRQIYVTYIESYHVCTNKNICDDRSICDDREQNKLIARLRELRADVHAIKAGRIEPVFIADFKKRVQESDWILFTSKNGVRAFFENMKKAKTDARILTDCKIGVVGKATAKELSKYYIQADIVAKNETGKGLGEELRTVLEKESNVCLFTAKESSTDIENVLGECCNFKKIVAYENIKMAIDEKAFQEVCGNVQAVFTSASNVRRFYEALPETVEIDVAYSIGVKTTEELRKHKCGQIVEADESSYEALVDAIVIGQTQA